MRARVAARLAAGIALATLTLWLAFRGTDVYALRRALLDIRVGWLLAALGSVGLSLAAIVVRWWLLFHPDQHGLRWRTLTAGVVVGQTVNILLPLRLGEIARTLLLSRVEHLPASRVGTTIAIERLADLVSIGLAAGVLLMSLSTPVWLRTPGSALLVTAAVALIGVVWLMVHGEASLRVGLRAAEALMPTRGQRLRQWLEPGVAGLAALKSARISLMFWPMSIMIVLLAASTNYLLFVAFALPLPVAAAFVLLLALQVGNSLVSVPGNLGVFHYVTVMVLGAYAVDRNLAAGYALVLYAVAILPKVLLGVLMMMRYGWAATRAVR